MMFVSYADHPWILNGKKAPIVPLGDIVRLRLKQFPMLNRLKGEFLRVMAEHLYLQEVELIKEMFTLMDDDNGNKITYPKLRAGLTKVGSQLGEPEIKMCLKWRMLTEMDVWNMESFNNSFAEDGE